DLADAVAVGMLDVHRAEEREMHERIAVQRAARIHLDVGCPLRHALSAHGPARVEVLAAAQALGTQQARRLAWIVRDGEEPRFDRYPGTGLLCHGVSSLWFDRWFCSHLSTMARSSMSKVNLASGGTSPLIPRCP